MLHRGGTWVVVLVGVWISVCSALTCDSGDNSTLCIISTPHNYTSDQVFIGNSLSVEAVINCSACSIMITMAGYITVSSSIVASVVTLKAPTTTVDGQISVGQNGTCSIDTTQGIVTGLIEGTYISVYASDFLGVSGNISASELGYGPNTGPGAGEAGPASRPGGGAGYGGYGADSSDYRDDGGLAYGSPIMPADLGSGGGNADITTYLGGRGGGFINITAGTFNLSGFVLANGQNGQSAISTLNPHGAGAGSGGSIDIIVGSMNFVSSKALVMANGGNGGAGFKAGACGGSGSGGRIWLNSTIPLTRESGNVVLADGGTVCSMPAGRGSVTPACPPGYEPESGYLYHYACVLCGPGTFSDDGEDCYYCPYGTFSNATGATSFDTCVECPEGTYEAGSNECYPCSAGRYNNLTGQEYCSSCAAGTFSNPGSAQCTLCPAGTYAGIGYSRCTNCSRGSIAPNPGSSKCTSCWPGSEVSKDGSKCDICPPGQYSYDAYYGCRNCSSGSVSPGNSSECTSCDTGYYAANGISCIACPAGSHTYDGKDCYPCDPGFVANQTGMDQCFGCPENTISSPDNTTCIPCPPNLYSNYAFTKCYKCRNLVGTTCLDLDDDSFDSPGGVNFRAFAIALPVCMVGVFVIIAIVIVFCVCRANARHRHRYPSTLSSSSSSYIPPSYPLTTVPPYTQYSPPSSPSYTPSSSSSSDPPNKFSPVMSDSISQEPSAPPAGESSNPTFDTGGSNVCAVCLERPKGVVFLPCGHVATCQDCANQVLDSAHPSCVICRAPIQSTTKIFM